MALTLPTVEAVRALVPAPLLSDAQVQAYIDDAALIAESCVASLDATRQAVIIKYLAAHLLTLAATTTGAASGALQSQSLGAASESYAVASTSDMLKGTVYGQQAMLFDPKGCLANLGKRGTIFRVLGQNRSRQYFDPAPDSSDE